MVLLIARDRASSLGGRTGLEVMAMLTRTYCCVAVLLALAAGILVTMAASVIAAKSLTSAQERATPSMAPGESPVATSETGNIHPHPGLGELGLQSLASAQRQRAAEGASKAMDVPPHEWQRQRVRNIADESVSQTVANLARFDDSALAADTVTGMAWVPTNAAFQNVLVTRLARTRRLFQWRRRTRRL
jgi:hypothetical protein